MLRQTEDVPGHLLGHLSPLGWKHVNLTATTSGPPNKRQKTLAD